MTLAIGTQLGSLEITALLGKGGMGEVYRARDLKLKREVAIKILPEEFSREADRVSRFQREAEVLASLNHANIAAIYGLDEFSGIRFLVLELVEGATLADRLRHGAIPVEESLKLALQIAEGLEAAHERGVIHRDLKPANIKVTDRGIAKVLDFGLAKVFTGDESDAYASSAPTLSIASSREGVILGTPAYMSPEQARGKPVDKRADIWAFGCVLYEMLSGSSAFPGDEINDVVAAVIRASPDWNRLPRSVPPSIKSLLQRCLDKDPRTRWRDIGDIRVEIERTLSNPQALRIQESVRHRSLWKVVAVLAPAALVVGLAAGALFQSLHTNTDRSAEAVRPATAGTIDLPPTMHLSSGTAAIGFDSTLIALSPDGEWIVYVGRGAGGSKLYRRRLNRFEDPQPIPGTDGAIHAFFGRDGRSVGFLTDDRVKRVSLEGDNLQTIAPTRTAIRAVWTENEWIYLIEDTGGNLRRVRSTGGDVEDVLISSGWHVTDVLPDGRFALGDMRHASISGDHNTIGLIDLTTKRSQMLPLSGYDPRWVPTGYLVFGRSGNLMAVPVDLGHGVVQGDGVPLLRDVAMDSLFPTVQIAISRSGALAYIPGVDRGIGKIVTLDRLGTERSLRAPPNKYGMLDLSPTNTAIAVHVADVKDYVWIYDLTRNEGQKVAGSDGHGFPAWNSTGTALGFSSGPLGSPGSTLMVQSMSSGAPPEAVYASDNEPLALSGWAPAGDVVSVYHFFSQRLGFLSLKRKDPIRWMEHLPGLQQPGHFSPDGRWLAYNSDESGQIETWVGSYPDFDNRHQLSTGGGVEPVWCPCGEVFFRRGNKFFSSTVRPGPEFSAEPARLAFEVHDFLDTPGRSYDVSSDGQTLYVVKRAEPAIDDRIHVISNWTEELKRLVPAK
jgi:serine/threonine protein kinase